MPSTAHHIQQVTRCTLSHHSALYSTSHPSGNPNVSSFFRARRQVSRPHMTVLQLHFGLSQSLASWYRVTNCSRVLLNTMKLHQLVNKSPSPCYNKLFVLVQTSKMIWTYVWHPTVRRVCSQNCEKRLLASLCPSVCMEQLGSHWTDFHEIWYLKIFRKYVKKIQVWLKSDRHNRYCTWRPIYIFDHISLNSS